MVKETVALQPKNQAAMAGRRRIRTTQKVEKISSSGNGTSRSSAVRKFNRADPKSNKGSRNRTFSKPTIKRSGPSKEGTRLNKYLANAGICSRREADKFITAGVVKINGKVVTELGTRVMPNDIVHYGDDLVKQENLVYVLLNKPKDFITTVDDPQGRRTVMDLVAGACNERLFPVGRLDRMTTGLLLLTNDGDLTKKLTHPKHEVRKLYQVTTEKKIHASILEKILDGVTLEDTVVNADKANFLMDDTSHKTVGIELHSGKNRVVRRMFEAVGHKVVKLDRVMFAGLSKKGLPRGHWRFLTEKEVDFLRMLG